MASFDLDAYISRYPPTSTTYLHRLLFLAHQLHTEHGHNDNSAAAFRMATSQMKSSGNFRRYLEEYEDEGNGNVASPSKSSNGHVIQQYIKYDPSFVSDAKASMACQLEVLEGRLSTAQSHINKESIRTALLALGEFLRGRGELREGWRRVVRSR
jgi:hypothetical protein